MFDDVVHSWDTWAASLRGARTLRRWAQLTPALETWTMPELRGPQASARTDAMQAALVSLAQQGDSAAVTTLLVQFRPGLGSLAAWLSRTDPRHPPFEAAQRDVRSTFCEVIVGHDLHRRPRKIAANLILDTRQGLWRALRRESIGADLDAGTGRPRYSADSRTDDAAAELDLVASVADALERLSGSDASRRLTAELAFRTWFLEEASADVAMELGLARNAARTRLCRLRQQMQLHLLERPEAA